MFIPFRNISNKQSVAATGLCVVLAYLSHYLDGLIEQDAAVASKKKGTVAWSSFEK
ncbi:hypothetical protein H310_02369 [Aphanomyces invadans]|uniref:Uncharacterized protein n=1 Tax=Aphanomyces invadans TaxID=157072 RepID=A0A024UQV2_9STRA|nr:hypothetical protein H310_02369 [Aphanomyces invadans]ETW07983.1 hypothetical protein H310_02369 [Aphanomyces invadans]|eukprot:XP_008864076.1 hypothetical protein H310_02369 [Aphanomyces invadans]